MVEERTQEDSRESAERNEQIILKWRRERPDLKIIRVGKLVDSSIGAFVPIQHCPRIREIARRLAKSSKASCDDIGLERPLLLLFTLQAILKARICDAALPTANTESNFGNMFTTAQTTIMPSSSLYHLRGYGEMFNGLQPSGFSRLRHTSIESQRNTCQAKTRRS